MLPGLGAGGFSASASSSASSGPIGDVSLHVGGIQTGGSSSGLPQWALLAGVVLLAIGAFYVLKRRS